MYPSATIERRIPKRLLFGAAVVALSSARLTPSSVLASASKRATSRIAERANEPSATAALSSARRESVARRTGWFLKGRNPFSSRQHSRVYHPAASTRRRHYTGAIPADAGHRGC